VSNRGWFLAVALVSRCYVGCPSLRRLSVASAGVPAVSRSSAKAVDLRAWGRIAMSCVAAFHVAASSDFDIESCVLEFKGLSPEPACFAGRFSHRLPRDTPLLGVPALQGLTGATLQRISPPLPSRSCRTAQVVLEPQGLYRSSCSARFRLAGSEELHHLSAKTPRPRAFFPSVIPLANEPSDFRGHW